MKKRWEKALGVFISLVMVTSLVPVSALAAQGDESAGGEAPVPELVLTTQDGAGANAVDMTLDEPCAASIEEDGYWVGKFTATEEGTYVFYSSGDYDTIGYLYSSAALDGDSKLDDNDDDGDDYNFSITRKLSANQTVYLKAQSYNSGVIDITVTVTKLDPNDLSSDFWGKYWNNSGRIVYTGKAIVNPGIIVQRWDDEAEENVTLKEGTDYKLSYYEDKDGQKLDATPVDCGDYAAVYEGKGGYHGTFRMYFDVFDRYNFGDSGWNVRVPDEYDYHYWSEETTEQIELTNGALVMPDVEFVCFGIGDDGEDVTLVKNTDYGLSGYLDANKNELEAAPTTPGLYYVVYAGKGDYHGSKVLPFRALGDRFDLTYATLKLYRTLYYWNGNPVSLEVGEVHDTNGGWLYQDEDYTLVYYNAKGEKLPGAPSDTGDYFVAIAPAEGTGYTGESAKVPFTILGKNDLRDADRFYASFPNGDAIVATGEAVRLPNVRIYDDYEEGHLVAGTDYVFSRYEDESGAVLAEAPSKIARYFAVYDGAGEYSGFIKVPFSICSANDLAFASLTIEDDTVLLIDGVAKPTVTVTDATGKLLTAGNDYALQYKDDDDNPVAAPNKDGCFRVRAVPGNSGAYTGNSSWYEFEVYDPQYLYSANIRLASDNVPLEKGVATVEATVTDAAGKVLSEGTDYVLRYEDDDDNPVATLNATGHYYVKAVPGSNNAYKGSTSRYGFTVYDPYDISDDETWDGEFWPNSYIPTTATSLPMALIYTYDNRTDVRTRLIEGADFQLARITNRNGDDLGKSVPSIPGDYFAVYEGIGENYHGTRAIAFSVYDRNNIGSVYWTGSFKGGNVFYTDGAPIELTEALIYNADSKERLVQGTDFEFVRFEDSDGKSLSATAPSKSDWYYAVYQGLGAYQGSTRKIGFQVRNSFDLSRARINLDKNTYQYNSEPVKLLAKVYDSDGIKLVEGTDYEFVYFEDGTELAGPPTNSGEYYVAAKAKEGGAYTGQSSSVYFTISAGEVGPIGPTDPVDLPLDTDVDATVAKDHYWLGKFTAPEAGAYVFFSKGDYDTYGVLYADAALSVELDEDDDGGNGSNFRIMTSLTAGQTVYLQSRGFSWRAVDCVVRAEKVNAYDLANASVTLKKYTIALVGDSVAPEATVVDVQGNTLKEGTDYELKYWYDDWNGYQPIEGTPTKPGDYYVKATSKEGGAYTGESRDYHFTVEDGHDLGVATIKLDKRSVEYTGAPVKPGVTVTAASGATLTEGVDYELVYLQPIYGGYEKMATAPTEVGTGYCMVACAKEGGNYTGQTDEVFFDIVDPADIAANWTVNLQSPAYYDNVGYASIPVYLFSGTAVKPGFSIWDEWTDASVDPSAYTVTFSNNDKVSTAGALATVTITGKAPDYKNSITKEFELVEKLDLAGYARYQECRVVAGSESKYYYYLDGSAKPQFLADGGAITPSVVFASGAATSRPVQGRDFTVSYIDSTGASIAEPTAPGKYQIVLTATEGGLCTGTGKVPFVITPTRDLGLLDISPSIRAVGALSYRIAYGEDDVMTYVFNELLSDVQGFTWFLYYNGAALIENLDYEVTEDAITDNLVTYFFTGEGGYEGTVKARVRGAETSAESFANRTASIGRDENLIVYVDENGKPEKPIVNVTGLVEGLDYTYGGLVNEAGATMATAKAGDAAFVKLVGAGTYAGCERKVAVQIAQGTSATNLSSQLIAFSLTNGVSIHDEGANGQWYLLRSAEPSVSLVAYGRNTLALDEGNGFTVSKTTSGNTMKLTLTATEGAPVSGSVTKDVTLVDSYPLSLIERVQLTGMGGDSSMVAMGENMTATLRYNGIAYMPTLTYSAWNILYPQVSLTLKDASGKAVDAITGAGSYTLTISGTGNWSGTLTIPISVVADTARINLSLCDLEVGSNTALANGAAKPTVTIKSAGYTLKEGTDYTLEYGSNTKNGARAWVKATAVKGSKFSGTAKANFTVGDEGKTFSVTDYELRLQRVSGNVYSVAGMGLVYALNGAASVKPAVQVVHRDAYGNATVLDSKYYDVEYGNASQPGVAYVKVTGKNGYEGTLAANYYVIAGNAKKSQVVTAENVNVKVGATAELEAKTSGDGALSYASSDEAVATVNSSGVITGKKAGEALITVTAAETKNYTQATKTVTVTVTRNAQVITAKDKVVQVKKTVKLAAKTSGNGALTYKTSNAKVATVDAKGVVTGKKAGTAKITITAAETAGYMKATKTVTVTVKKANTLVIKTATRQLSLNTLKTKGQAFKPAVVKKKGKGTLTYAKKSVTSKYKKYVTVAKNGTVTVKKGAPKGKCVLNLNVKAAGNASYMPVTKNAKVTITIK